MNPCVGSTPPPGPVRREQEMHAEPQALAFIAAAGAIRKPTPGAARATKLIESVDAIVHRSGSFAAGIGALQADVHTLCDEIARLKTPASHYPWQSLEVRGRTWMVLPCKTCDFTGELQAASLWVNGAWLEAEDEDLLGVLDVVDLMEREEREDGA